MGRTLILWALLLPMGAAGVAESGDCPTLLERLATRSEEVLYDTKTQVKQFWERVKAAWQRNRPSSGGMPQQADYPRLPRTYRAHNKDTDPAPPDGKSHHTPRVAINSVPIPGLTYFRGARYQHIEPATAQISLASSPLRSAPTGDVANTVPMKVNRIEEGHGDALFVPVGFEPVVESDRKMVGMDDFGNFVMGKTPVEFEVALRPESARDLTARERKIYTTVSRVPLSRWPAWLQVEIERLHAARRNGMGDMELSLRLGRYISDQMVYQVGMGSQMGAEELAKSGLAQCDGANVILTTILRGEFKIVSAVATGMVGVSKNGDGGSSHVVSPGIGHAWTEVFDESTKIWRVVDATPQRPDKHRKNSDKHNDEFEQPKTENPEAISEELVEEEKQKHSPSPSPETAEEKAAREQAAKEAADALREIIEQEMQRKAKEAQEAHENRHVPHPNEKNPAGASGESAVAQAEWMHALEAVADAPELTRRLREYVAKHQKLQKSSKLETEQKDRAVKLLEQIENAGLDHRSLDQFAAQVQSSHTVPNSPGPKIKISALRDVMLEIAEVRRLAPQEQVVLDKLHETYHQLTPSKDGATPELESMARALWKTTQGALSRRFLLEQYGSGGDEPSWSRLGLAIQLGELDRFMMASHVKPYLGLFTESTLRPAPRMELGGKTYELGNGEANFTPVQSADRIANAVRDGMSPEFDLIRMASGELREPVYQKLVPSKRPNGLEKETQNFLIIDMSGSNDWHDRHVVRDGLAMGLLDRAYSEKSKHAFTLIPYWSEPGEVVPLGTDADLAYREFKRLATEVKSQDGDGGTGTAEAVGEAYKLSQGTRKQRYNFFLLTDGHGSIDTRAIQAYRAKLDPQSQVNFAAVTYIDGNEAIQKLAAAGRSTAGSKRWAHLSQADVERLNAAVKKGEYLKGVAQEVDSGRLNDKKAVELRTALADLDYQFSEREFLQSAPSLQVPAERIAALSQTGSPEAAPLSPLLPLNLSAWERRRFLSFALRRYAQGKGWSIPRALEAFSAEERDKLQSWMDTGRP